MVDLLTYIYMFPLITDVNFFSGHYHREDKHSIAASTATIRQESKSKHSILTLTSTVLIGTSVTKS